MKKIFVVRMLVFGAFLAVFASCGSGRHKCPAYGSLENQNDFNTELAEAK